MFKDLHYYMIKDEMPFHRVWTGGKVSETQYPYTTLDGGALVMYPHGDVVSVQIAQNYNQEGHDRIKWEAWKTMCRTTKMVIHTRRNINKHRPASIFRLTPEGREQFDVLFHMFDRL